MKTLYLLGFLILSSFACKQTEERKPSKSQAAATETTTSIDPVLRAQIDTFSRNNLLTQQQYTDLVGLAETNPVAAQQLMLAAAQPIPETPPPIEKPKWVKWLEESPFKVILKWTRAWGDKYFPWL